MTQYLPVLTGLAASLSVLSLFVGLYRVMKPAGELEGRLAEVAKRAVAAPSEPFSVRWSRFLQSFKLDNKLAGKIALELEQADLAMTVNEYVLMRVGGAIVGVLAGGLLLGNLLFGLVFAVVALQAPVFYVHNRIRKRHHRFQTQLVDVITLLTSGLRAGVGLMQAMELVRREMPAPGSEEFGRVVREVSLGASLEDALDHLLARMPGDDLGMLVAVINIQAEVGGNLVTILETVVTTIRERVRVAQEIRTLTAQQRMTGYVLAGLPFIVGGALMVINPEYMRPLFEPQWMWMPVSAVVMMGVGFFIISRIVDIKV